MAVDTEQVSAASDAVVPRETHMIPKVVPKLAAAPQAASEVVQLRPPIPRCRHLLRAVSRSSFYEVDAPFHSYLCRHPFGPASGNVLVELSMYDSVISLDYPLCRHPVWPDGGSVFAELDMSLYDPCPCVCRQLLAFDPAVHRTAAGEGEMYSLSPYFRLILTFCYCFYDFLREQELETGRSPDTDKADSFHGQSSWGEI